MLMFSLAALSSFLAEKKLFVSEIVHIYINRIFLIVRKAGMALLQEGIVKEIQGILPPCKWVLRLLRAACLQEILTVVLQIYVIEKML